ncbi:hypothetical protein Acr_00g0099750 [Actinidia rufa]|uniref:Uncharacterized protein n=1 Tax=Actinidia rufa TaxID=165716 RepID=A0A7J0DZY3_9ERIC|nr:hypothetical protein Acr_00g0099750 [Actinidia rufa]
MGDMGVMGMRYGVCGSDATDCLGEVTFLFSSYPRLRYRDSDRVGLFYCPEHKLGDPHRLLLIECAQPVLWRSENCDHLIGGNDEIGRPLLEQNFTTEALKIWSLASVSHRVCSVLKRAVGIRSRQQTVAQVHRKLGIVVPTYGAKLLWRTNVTGWGEAAQNPSGVEIKLSQPQPSAAAITHLQLSVIADTLCLANTSSESQHSPPAVSDGSSCNNHPPLIVEHPSSSLTPLMNPIASSNNCPLDGDPLWPSTWMKF